MDTTTATAAATAISGIDAALIVSLAALALSILSPLATAWLQGRYRLKEKQLEASEAAKQREQAYYIEHRAEAIENYIRAGMRLSASNVPSAKTEFEATAGEAYFYLGKEYWGFLERVEICVSGHHYEGIRTPMMELCRKLVDNGDMPRQPLSNTPKGEGR